MAKNASKVTTKAKADKSAKVSKTSVQMVDKDKLNKDIENVMKKHGIASGVFITQEDVNGSRITLVVAQDVGRKPDQKLAKAVIGLFREIRLDVEDINSITCVVKGIKQNRSPQEIADDAIEAAMSLKNRKLLNEYREKKNQLVREGKYDEASEYREKEKKLMGKI